MTWGLLEGSVLTGKYSQPSAELRRIDFVTQASLAWGRVGPAGQANPQVRHANTHPHTANRLERADDEYSDSNDQSAIILLDRRDDRPVPTRLCALVRWLTGRI